MKLNNSQQYEVAKHVSDLYADYSDRLAPWKSRMLDILQEYSTFKSVSKDKWMPDFKVNKAHEIVDKCVAKIMAGAPTWMVDSIDYDIENEQEKQISDDVAFAVKEFLQDTYSKEELIEVAELVAKAMFIYGLVFSKTSFKYNVTRDKVKKTETIDGIDGEYTDIVDGVDEDIASEYPCIEAKSWADIVFDPRYTRLEDFPAIIETNANIRLSYFTKNPKRFMNVDQLVDCCMASSQYQGDERGYRSQIEAILGISGTSSISKFDAKSLNVKCYYGYYDLGNNDDQSGERLYEFWVVNDLIVIYADEITYMPFEDARCSYDTESFLAVGIVEPMMGLQKEMNFKKTSAAKYINQTLNRQFVRSPQSGINPATLNDPIVVATNGGEQAMANMYEMPHRNLSPDYFNDLQDQERQIQAVTFTVDTSNTKSTGALTNTATGSKIDYAESNIVMDSFKKHFEQWLVRSAYKLLQVAYDKMEGTIKITATDGRIILLNKEVFRDAIKKFKIRIEVGSTSWDSKQSKRDDMAAVTNIAGTLMNMGFQGFDLGYLAEKSVGGFDMIDPKKAIKKQMPMMGMIPPGQPGQAPM